MRLILRAFVPAANTSAAAAIGRRLVGALAAVAGVDAAAIALAIDPHTRRQGFRECDLRIAPATLATTRAVVASAAAGWTPARIDDALLSTDHDEDLSIVWNRGAHPPLLDASVHWAELLLVHD